MGMHRFNLTLDTPAENLALDEALLDTAESRGISEGVLRLWESPQTVVVLGRSSPAEVEVDLRACKELRVPVLRRSSGGGTVVAGPGCLMYAVLLDYQNYPQLRAIDLCHQFVLGKVADGISKLVPNIHLEGTSDLALSVEDGTPILHKFSGNAMRAKRDHVLYHGTLLYNFDLDLLTKLLATPTRTPEYRDERAHRQFVTNLPVTRALLEEALTSAWSADVDLGDWPAAKTAEIVRQKYLDDDQWTILSADR